MTCHFCNAEARFTDSIVDLDNSTEHNTAYKRVPICQFHMRDRLENVGNTTRILPIDNEIDPTQGKENRDE